MDIYVSFNPISRLVLHFLLLLFLASSCLNTSNTEVESCMEEERQALLTFKQDLDDPSGRLSSWVGHKCCQWRGISCNNRTGHVAIIDLRNSYQYHHKSVLEWSTQEDLESRLRGKLNPSLISLKHLSYLDLSNNYFQGIHIPKFIGQLTSLRYLNLSCSFPYLREIPQSLGNLSNLNYLDLSYETPDFFNAYGRVSSKNLNWLSHLSSLKYLNLGGVDLSSTGVSWLHVVNMLPSLLELHLPGCQIRNLPLLQYVNFTTLSILDMSSNWLVNSSFPKWMFNLTNLAKLDLSRNLFIHPSLDEFVRLKYLEHLDLGFIGLRGQVPTFFGSLCELKFLVLQGNEFNGGMEEFLGGFSNCSFNRLESLDLSSCGLVGKLPSSLGMLKSLQHLYLQFNSFSGSIPEVIISNLSSSLKTLDLRDNHLNGSIPQSLGQLSHLDTLFLAFNSWEGSLTEAHFINLTRLKNLELSTTGHVPITFNLTDHGWIPPFKLRFIIMRNCQVGPGFPVWLESQTELLSVTLHNAGFTLATPEEWFLKLSSKITRLDLSYNQLSGKLPDRFNSLPNLDGLMLSHNQFNGTIPSSICSLKFLTFLLLDNNQLSGEFPKEWSLWSYIWGVDVSNNRLSGNIPSSMGIPSSLCVLKTDNNQFSGVIPSALQNSSHLMRLYLGGNKFTGSIPSWIGSKLSYLAVLQLQSNTLSGHIPHHLCNLPSLQILDLSHNRFSGTIPRCLNNLTSLVYGPRYWTLQFIAGFVETTVTTKGRTSEYATDNAQLLVIINLSSNDLEGEIPDEMSSLVQLGTLNLSMNQLSGGIPSKIGNLRWLETLDLSRNQLSGQIPQSLSNLTFLSHLNLSCNHLTGRIPSGNQLQTLDDPSIYQGNPSLCGFPLPECREDEPHAKDEKDGDGDDYEKLGFYTSAVLGFIIGFWSVCGTLILKTSWRYAYFQFFDNIKEKVALAIALKVARLQGRVVR